MYPYPNAGRKMHVDVNDTIKIKEESNPPFGFGEKRGEKNAEIQDFFTGDKTYYKRRFALGTLFTGNLIKIPWFSGINHINFTVLHPVSQQSFFLLTNNRNFYKELTIEYICFINQNYNLFLY